MAEKIRLEDKVKRSTDNWRKRWNGDMKPLSNRLLAYLDMLFLDHGILRLIYKNKFAIAEGVERSNHPAPCQVARAARRGTKTIINLRGRNNYGTYPLEKRACQRHGVNLVDFKIKSRQLPKKEHILQAKEMFEKIQYPVLMHCKSGADRVGFMSAIYLMLQQQQPVETAMKQLAIKYGHVRASKTGILVFFLQSYQQANKEKPIGFLDWVENQYDPQSLAKEFRPNGWMSWFIDKVLRRE